MDYFFISAYLRTKWSNDLSRWISYYHNEEFSSSTFSISSYLGALWGRREGTYSIYLFEVSAPEQLYGEASVHPDSSSTTKILV